MLLQSLSTADATECNRYQQPAILSFARATKQTADPLGVGGLVDRPFVMSFDGGDADLARGGRAMSTPCSFYHNVNFYSFVGASISVKKLFSLFTY